MLFGHKSEVSVVVKRQSGMSKVERFSFAKKKFNMFCKIPVYGRLSPWCEVEIIAKKTIFIAVYHLCLCCRVVSCKLTKHGQSLLSRGGY